MNTNSLKEVEQFIDNFAGDEDYAEDYFSMDVMRINERLSSDRLRG